MASGSSLESRIISWLGAAQDVSGGSCGARGALAKRAAGSLPPCGGLRTACACALVKPPALAPFNCGF